MPISSPISNFRINRATTEDFMQLFGDEREGGIGFARSLPKDTVVRIAKDMHDLAQKTPFTEENLSRRLPRELKPFAGKIARIANFEPAPQRVLNSITLKGDKTVQGVFGSTDAFTMTNAKYRVQNNLWYDSIAPGSVNGGGASDYARSHNAYFDTDSSLDNDPNKQVSAGNPFVNSNARDFRLAAPTLPGISLPSPFNLDSNGNTRGSGGVWDRGAFEYGGSGNPTRIDGLCGSSNNICLAGTLNDTADNATQYLWQCAGANGGSNGTVTVTGTNSTWTDNDDIFVGSGSTGALNITSGGSVSDTYGNIGGFAGSNGTVTVNGTPFHRSLSIHSLMEAKVAVIDPSGTV